MSDVVETTAAVEYAIANHCAALAKVPCGVQFDAADWKGLKRSIAAVDWRNYFAGTVDQAANAVVAKLLAVAGDHIPKNQSCSAQAVTRGSLRTVSMRLLGSRWLPARLLMQLNATRVLRCCDKLIVSTCTVPGKLFTYCLGIPGSGGKLAKD